MEFFYFYHNPLNIQDLKTHIILLRGVNVGGHRKIKMAEFKQLLIDQGFQNVITYIQSGNILCQGNQSKPAIKQQIESLILKNYGFEVTAFVLDQTKLKNIIQDNPFISQQIPIEKLYCTFLEKQPDPKTQKKFLELKTQDEVFTFAGPLLYFCYHKGYGKAKLSNPVVEKKLKMQATTRNWKTMTKLLDMSI